MYSASQSPRNSYIFITALLLLFQNQGEKTKIYSNIPFPPYSQSTNHFFTNQETEELAQMHLITVGIFSIPIQENRNVFKNIRSPLHHNQETKKSNRTIIISFSRQNHFFLHSTILFIYNTPGHPVMHNSSIRHSSSYHTMNSNLRRKGRICHKCGRDDFEGEQQLSWHLKHCTEAKSDGEETTRNNKRSATEMEERNQYFKEVMQTKRHDDWQEPFDVLKKRRSNKDKNVHDGSPTSSTLKPEEEDVGRKTQLCQIVVPP